MSKTKLVAFRLPIETVALLAKASDKKKNPYAPTRTQLVVRGVQLALIEAKAK